MSTTNDCPFCNLDSDERIIVETEFAFAVCDARPAVVGHVLAIPKAHVASAFDLEPLVYAHLRLVQNEVMARIRFRFGDCGAYEHGRSLLCRFHAVNNGHAHAHVHLLPVGFDLIERSGYETVWDRRPNTFELQDSDRYLYEEIGSIPRESWATGKFSVQRHFVRSAFQIALEGAELPWVQLETPQIDHDENVDRTYELLRASISDQEVQITCVICADEQLEDDLRQCLLKRMTDFDPEAQTKLRSIGLGYGPGVEKRVVVSELVTHESFSNSENNRNVDLDSIGLLRSDVYCRSVNSISREESVVRTIVITNTKTAKKLPEHCHRVIIEPCDGGRDSNSAMEVGSTWFDTRIPRSALDVETIADLILTSSKLRFESR